jgi:hypothetical protein
MLIGAVEEKYRDENCTGEIRSDRENKWKNNIHVA